MQVGVVWRIGYSFSILTILFIAVIFIVGFAFMSPFGRGYGILSSISESVCMFSWSSSSWLSGLAAQLRVWRFDLVLFVEVGLRLEKCCSIFVCCSDVVVVSFHL